MTSIASISSSFVAPLRDFAQPPDRHPRPDRTADRLPDARRDGNDVDPGRIRKALADHPHLKRRLAHAAQERGFDRGDVDPARLRHALADRIDRHRDRPDVHRPDAGRIRPAIADQIDRHVDRPRDLTRVIRRVVDRVDRDVDPGRIRHALADRLDRPIDRPEREVRSDRVRPVDIRV